MSSNGENGNGVMVVMWCNGINEQCNVNNLSQMKW